MTTQSAIQRVGAGGLGLACAVSGATLAWFHPLFPVPLLGAFALVVCACMLSPSLWLFAVPALLPLAGFAPWSGWFSFEEFDILVLAAAAGGYLHRMAAPRGGPALAPHGGRLSVISLSLVALYGATLLLAMQRGFADAGGFRFGWFQGYDDPMNSLRVGKSFFFALLLLPLALREARRAEGRFVTRLAAGLLAGLTVAGLLCVWERLAFPGLLNFSDDYRTTALFWEMHVGGAALDGFLVLTVPFALWATLNARTPLRLTLALALVGLASYACLTTFSRGVYLGAVVGLAVLVVLWHAQSILVRKAAPQDGAVSLFRLFWVVIAADWAGYLAFRAGGYRALLAVLGVFAITLLSGAVMRRRAASGLPAGLALGALCGACATGFALVVDKGAYLSFAAAFACCGLILAHQRGGLQVRSMPLLIAGYVWLVASALLVAYNWGGEPALLDMSLALPLVVTLAVWNGLARQAVWPAGLRWQGGLFAVVLMLAGAIAIFGGGAYMSGRFSTSGQDFGGRLKHWSDGVDLLQSPAEWLLGKGLGRFPATYFFSSRNGEFPGGYRLQAEDGNRFLRLSGPKSAVGFGEYLRVGQRVPVRSRYRLEFDARGMREASLQIEVCEKHLLYRAGCAMAHVRVKGDGQSWQHFAVDLDGKELWGGPWYAPRLAFFAVAVDTPGALIDVDNFTLRSAGTDNLLPNGNFEHEMAHWFFTSDHHHLPWHIKNLLLNVLFDQGLLGLLLFAGLLAGALWRLTLGGAKEHPVAPYLASALVGCLVVGGFDSLLDVPRVAFLFYFLVLLALMLNGSATARPKPASARRRSSGAQRASTPAELQRHS